MQSCLSRRILSLLYVEFCHTRWCLGAMGRTRVAGIVWSNRYRCSTIQRYLQRLSYLPPFARVFLFIKPVSTGSNTEDATVSPNFGEGAKRQLATANSIATMHAAMNNIDFILYFFRIYHCLNIHKEGILKASNLPIPSSTAISPALAVHFRHTHYHMLMQLQHRSGPSHIGQQAARYVPVRPDAHLHLRKPRSS